MFLRTTLNVFAKSRHKVLIKRRKVELKNRPMSKKKLKEEQNTMNISYQMKKLDIRKEMDKAKSTNHHLNEIIEDLFYPDISLNNQDEVDRRVRQVSSEALDQEREWEEMVRMDYLTSEIMQSSLPLQLLSIHQEKGDQFLVEHYLELMKKMNTYCFRRESIKQKRMENWSKMMKKIKSKDPKAKEVPCPYLFLERQQITRHQFWINLVEGMQMKMEEETRILEFNRYTSVLLQIQRTFYHIPGQLYQLILNRNASANIEELRGEVVSDLLVLFKYRNKLKFSPSIKIDTPQDMPKEANHLYLARKLATEVIENPEMYSAEDLINVFKIISSRKRKMAIIQQYQYEKVEAIMGSLLNELSFESVETFFVIYCTLNHNPNLQFAQIVKFDLFRKAEECKMYFYVLDLITKIKERQLTFKVYQPKGVEPKLLQLQSYDLLIRLTEVITKMLGNLKSHELIQVLDCYFENDIRDQSVVEILSTQIIKKGAEYSLQILGKSLFKLTLLGHSSKIAAKYVFEQFSKRYHDQMKKYKEEGVFLLPTDQPVQAMKMNFNQIYLQECLLMMLWAVTKQLEGRLEKEIYLSTMFNLFPVKIQSGDPLALELSINVNQAVKEFGYFPKITCPVFGSEDFPVGRLGQFYGRDFSRKQLDLLMQEQARESKQFMANYNPKQKMFLPERWSNKNTYNSNAYANFCLKHQDPTSVQKGNCFFDAEVILSESFLAKRSEILQTIRSELDKGTLPKKQSEVSQRGSRMYDLL